MRFLKASVLCLCAVLVFGATPALAKKKKKPAKLGPVSTVTAAGNTVSGASAASTATATCPAGKVAVGGGFSSVRDDVSTTAFPTESYRNGTQSWTVTAVIGGSVSFSGSVNAIAYCRSANRAISDVTATGSSAPSGFAPASASATCPGGQQLVAGGFQSTYSPAFFLLISQNSSPQPGIWSVAGANINGTSRTITAHAYCMPGLKAPRVVSTATTAAPDSSALAQQTSPACPVAKKTKKSTKKKKKKKHPPQLLSAGGFSSPPATASGAIPIYEDSMANGSAWFVRLISIGSKPVPVTSQGICA